MKTNKAIERRERLIPNGIPRYIRCYDNGGETFDRYTVVYTGNYRRYITIELERTRPRYYQSIGMSANPFDPQGFGLHGESNAPIDRPKYSHLGKKIKFEQLPDACKKAVMNDYVENWDIDINQ